MLNVQKALENFGDSVIVKARKNVPKASNDLSKSLSYKTKVSKSGQSFEFDMFAEDYWEFIDRGVKGVGGTKADGTRWKLKRVRKSPFSYKNKRPPTRVFDKWVIRKGLAPRNKQGRFASRESLKFALAESVYRTGIETTNFLTKPFEQEFKKLPDEIVEAFGLDVDELLKFAFK